MSRPLNDIDFRVLAEKVPALICYLDSDLRYRYHNDIHNQWWAGSRVDNYGKHFGGRRRTRRRFGQPHRLGNLRSKIRERERIEEFELNYATSPKGHKEKEDHPRRPEQR